MSIFAKKKQQDGAQDGAEVLDQKQREVLALICRATIGSSGFDASGL